jgi:hypothetical protein
MVATQQYSFAGKSGLFREGMNKLGKVRGSLSSVAARLIHLARSGFDVHDRFILDRLLQRCGDNARVSRADSINPDSLGAAIAKNYLLQSLTCILRLRSHSGCSG